MLRYFVPAKLAACLLLLQLVSSTFAQSAQPVAPMREVTDNYFGQNISDPYRWMEDSKSPEMVAWMKGQSDYTRAYLDHLPIRQELLERITKLSDAGVAVTRVQHRGSLYFYYRLAPGENDRKLYVRDRLDGRERVLVDPETFSAPSKRYSIDEFNASLDANLFPIEFPSVARKMVKCASSKRPPGRIWASALPVRETMRGFGCRMENRISLPSSFSSLGSSGAKAATRTRVTKD